MFKSKIVRLGTGFDRPNVMRFLKKFVFSVFVALIMSFYLFSDRADVSVQAKVFGGPPLGFTGAPDEGTCIGCHYTFGQPNVPNSGGSVQLSGLPSIFSPGQTYNLTVTVAHPTARRWGFETTVLNAAGNSSTIGTLTILDAIKTIKRDAGARTYVSHFATETSLPAEDGTAPGKAGSNSWSFNWTAPGAATGDVTFYAAGNAANNQVSPEDDYIYTTSVVVRAPNSAPVFASLADRILVVGDTISFDVPATDPEGAPVSVTASALPNSTFDSIEKRFTFTAATDQLGTKQVTFTATDGSLSTQETINLHVSAEGPALLIRLSKTSGPSNYLDSSEATSIDLTAVGDFGASAKVVFNGLELGSQTSLTGPESLATQIPASELTNPGAYVVRVKQSNGSLTNARRLGLASTVSSQQATTVEAASFSSLVAAGEIGALFGSNLIVEGVGASASTLPLPRSLQGTSVFVNGVPAPLFYAGPGQINYQLPYSTVAGQAEVVALRDDGVAAFGAAQIGTVAPAVFTANSTGQGQAAALNSDYTPNGDPAANPQLKRAHKGDYISLFASGTGAGLVNAANGAAVAVKDGEAATSSPLIATFELPVITIGGKAATVYFSGLAPGFVGLWQINVQVPADAPSGAAVEVLMTFGGRSSNRVTIAVD
ncbi:MAG: choice-of-anchor V domain-containing protein [Acidobacteriota bacterium]